MDVTGETAGIDIRLAVLATGLGVSFGVRRLTIRTMKHLVDAPARKRDTLNPATRATSSEVEGGEGSLVIWT